MKTNRIAATGITYSSFLFGYVLPFSVNFANYALTSFYVFGLFNYIVLRPKLSSINLRLLRYSTLLLLPSLLFSVFGGLELELLFKGLERRLPFLLTPFIFLILPKENIVTVKEKALSGLVIGVFLSAIFLIVNILYEFYLTRPLFSFNKNLFNYYHTHNYFTRVLDIHPSYYGMFVITGLATVYFYKGFKSPFLNVIFVILSLTVILFLNSRIILFLFVLLNLIYLIRYFYFKTRKIFKTFLLTVGVLFTFSILLFSITNSTYAYQRVFKETLWEFSNGTEGEYNFKNDGEPRMARWGAALNVIERKPFLGYGVFKETETLKSEYYTLNMKSSFANSYNAHNQFLGFAIEGGIITAMALLFFFLVNFYISLRNKDLVYFIFVFSVFSICLVENYLVRNAGIIFIGFFSSVFLFNSIENDR